MYFKHRYLTISAGETHLKATLNRYHLKCRIPYSPLSLDLFLPHFSGLQHLHFFVVKACVTRLGGDSRKCNPFPSFPVAERAVTVSHVLYQYLKSCGILQSWLLHLRKQLWENFNGNCFAQEERIPSYRGFHPLRGFTRIKMGSCFKQGKLAIAWSSDETQRQSPWGRLWIGMWILGV